MTREEQHDVRVLLRALHSVAMHKPTSTSDWDASVKLWQCAVATVRPRL
jgi:hypothetical protein